MVIQTSALVLAAKAHPLGSYFEQAFWKDVSCLIRLSVKKRMDKYEQLRHAHFRVAGRRMASWVGDETWVFLFSGEAAGGTSCPDLPLCPSLEPPIYRQL